MNDITIPLQVAGGETITLAIDPGRLIPMAVDTTITANLGEHYQGPYAVTPAAHGQTLNTAGRIMDQDLVVEAIPSNYGLVTWDGSVLTVS